MRPQLLYMGIALCLATSCTKDDDNNSQPPIPNNQALTWIKTFGGTNDDFAMTATQLTGGDYVFAGATRSTDGDLSGTRVGYDFWITRLSSDGTKQWSTALGSGSNDDYATGIVPTSDGNLVLAGYGFNTGQNFASAMKVSGTGNKIWEKQISTSTDAKAYGLVALDDGSTVVAGYERSGSAEGLVVKLDASGNTVWKKTFGGAGDDILTGIARAGDGFILSGYTKSSDGDLSGNRGNFDGWILKLDASGNKVWSKSYGGADVDYLNGVVVTADGNYVVAGYTKSNGGDVPGNKGGNEAWILKLDGSGNKLWAKTYGGVNEEYITSLVKAGEGVIILGHTNSTTGDVTRTYNDFGGWLVKLDASGNKVAASTYGDRADDFTANIIATQDGGYLISGNTDLTASSRGYDGWLVKVGNF